MPVPVLICDDSSFARKQMARALPADWDAEVGFAGNGEEALAAIAEGKADLLFLDLNMPVMDGYGVLEAIRARDLPTLVIVVSGDIQPEAHARVMGLGAMEFIKKPVQPEEIGAILEKYGLRGKSVAPAAPVDVELDLWDGYRELANVAMGRAADLLARVLDAFVVMPIPNVNLLEMSELRMTLAHIDDGHSVSAVCQGFIGAGLSGEALLVFDEASLDAIATLMRHEETLSEPAQVELLMDTASILVGACLKGIADQLDIGFSQGHPMVLGRHVNVADLLARTAQRRDRILTIELGFAIEGHRISGNILLLLTQDSVESLDALLEYTVA